MLLKTRKFAGPRQMVLEALQHQINGVHMLLLFCGCCGSGSRLVDLQSNVIVFMNALWLPNKAVEIACTQTVPVTPCLG